MGGSDGSGSSSGSHANTNTNTSTSTNTNTNGGSGSGGVPERPRGQREEAPPPRVDQQHHFGGGFGPFANFGRGGGGGFTVHFGWNGAAAAFGGANREPLSAEDQHRVMVSRLLLSVGMAVLVALLYA